MIPKGTLLIIGGSEDKGEHKEAIEGKNKNFESFEILKELTHAKRQKRIEIITTASEIPEEMQKMYKETFKRLKFTDIDFLDIKDKSEAREMSCCSRIKKAHAVFFCGGDQFKLSATLGGTPFTKAIREKYIYDKDFVIAGTSAGAMAMSKLMIYEGGVNEAILKDDLKMSSGLCFLDTCIIDTHFIKRGRFGRLAHAVIMNPESLGIGLGEDTALIIKKGSETECRGSGMVVIIDGDYIGETNITDVEDGAPIFVENLKVHFLVHGSKFSIKNRKFISSRKKQLPGKAK